MVFRKNYWSYEVIRRYLQLILTATEMRMFSNIKILRQRLEHSNPTQIISLSCILCSRGESQRRGWSDCQEGEHLQGVPRGCYGGHDVKVLPHVAAEISGSISQAYSITMIICGDGAIGLTGWNNIFRVFPWSRYIEILCCDWSRSHCFLYLNLNKCTMTFISLSKQILIWIRIYICT